MGMGHVRARAPGSAADRVASLRRHDLVRVAPEDWAEAVGASPRLRSLPPAARARVRDWAWRGWPAMVRRRAEGEAPDAVPLGVPLPPSLGKLRVPVSLPPDAAWARVDGPGLAAAAAGAPPALAEAAMALEGVGAAAGVVPRPYGALLWAAATGLPYLHAGSDLDVLWPITAATDLGSLLDTLRAAAAAARAPVDGEILLPDGWGVQWRELDRAWRRPGGEVLAKAVDGLSLLRVDRFARPASP